MGNKILNVYTNNQHIQKLFELFTEALVDPKNRLSQNYPIEDLHSTENHATVSLIPMKMEMQ